MIVRMASCPGKVQEPDDAARHGEAAARHDDHLPGGADDRGCAAAQVADRHAAKPELFEPKVF